MPTQPQRNCTKPNCAGVVSRGVCSVCGSKRPSRWRETVDNRSAHERGYGNTWRKLRRMVLAENPLCVECQRIGRVTAAQEVDHIVPKHLGGPDDWDNLQPLCRACHRAKTARDASVTDNGWRTSTIPCTIVAGAPGSGKSYYVKQRMMHGDLVIDVDALYSALSGLAWYDKPVNLLPFVIEARDAIIRRLAKRSKVRSAWFITSEADCQTLIHWRDTLQARLVIMDTSPNECMRRIANDERRSKHADAWRPLVSEWWQTFEQTRQQGGEGRLNP